MSTAEEQTSTNGTPVSYSAARRIAEQERDLALGLKESSWPNPAARPAGWEIGPGHLWRVIDSKPQNTADHKLHSEGRLICTPLHETMLRFPSAPLHGIQRRHQHHCRLPLSEGMHTCRVLMSVEPAEKIERIYLFHNGLNEVRNMGLYYQLAAHLISEDAAAACVLRPFPGHLTRAPYAGYSETPLDKYLADGSHLFRQFIRYMAETQWFLSAIVKRSRYRCPSGAGMLAESKDIAASRLETHVLAGKMREVWEQMHAASETALDHAPPEWRTEMDPEVPEKEVFEEAIDALRSCLRLRNYDDLDDRTPQSEEHKSPAEPSLHVIGYSIGGFTAQSVFMSWPFLVASCTTLLSGGALRELSPTAFANPEEWQTVLHSLRYELDDGMLHGRYGKDPERLAGIERDLFLYLQRTFYEVFEQEYRGSFQSRLAAFRSRMLFVVGGDDAVVRPSSVLDSAPPGGINLFEVGGLGHFIGAPTGQNGSKGTFGLPEIARLMSSFATQAVYDHVEERRKSWLDEKLKVPVRKGSAAKVTRLSQSDMLDIGASGELPSGLFDAYLDDLLARQRQSPKGLLLVVRNEIPTMLLNEDAVLRRARALHHDDARIVEYCHGVRTRFAEFKRSIDRTHVILPWNVRELFLYMDPPSGYPSQAEPAVGQMPEDKTPAAIWPGCEQQLIKLESSKPASILVFDGREPVRARQGGEIAHQAVAAVTSLDREAEKAPRAEGVERNDAGGLDLRVRSLPDCWIWVSQSFLQQEDEGRPNETIDAFVNAAYFNHGQPKSDLARRLRNDEIRVITVSRARYNSRFRGGLVVDPGVVKTLLLHVAWCLTGAHRLAEFNLVAGEARDLPASVVGGEIDS